MTQICNLLNNPAPRPGELFHLALTTGKDEPVLLESTMPGAVDFDKGLLQVDHQIWPLFQVLDLDHILTCAEVIQTSSKPMICPDDLRWHCRTQDASFSVRAFRFSSASQ